jgi:hypothetical protein
VKKVKRATIGQNYTDRRGHGGYSGMGYTE